MPAIKTVSIIGATGAIGPFIVKALVTAGFTVTIITRAVNDSTSVATAGGPRQKTPLESFPDDIPKRMSDYSHTSLVKLLTGQDAVVSTVGPAGTEVQKVVIDAAIAAGVRRFVPSEYGYDTINWPKGMIAEIAFAMKSKKEILDYLVRKTKEEGCGLSWTGVGSGAFLDWAIGNDAMGFDCKKRRMTIFDGGDAVFTGSTGARVGEAVVRVLEREEVTKNKFLYVRSVKTTQMELLAAFENFTDAKWEAVPVRTEDAYAQGEELLKEGKIMQARQGFVAKQFFEKGEHMRGMIARDDAEGMSLLGLKDQTLEEVIEAGLAWGKVQ